MFCSNCGKMVREGAKFCGNCGAPVEMPDIADIAVPSAAAEPEVPAVETGEPLAEARAVTATPVEEAASAQESKPVSAKDFVPGNELYKFKMVTKTMGASTFATDLGTGTLHVYDNGMQFSGFLGASVGSGVLGTIASVVVTIADELFDPNIYPLEQIQELSVGKRLGVYNMLVITMKNGDVWSFCPAMPGSSAPKNIITMLKPYMDKLNG